MPIAAHTTSAAVPAASHFSCWRRSPEERRQLATWPASDATKHTATSKKIKVYAVFHHPAAGFASASEINAERTRIRATSPGISRPTTT